MAKKARTVTLNLDGKHPNYKIQANTWRMDFDSYGREDVDRSWELSFDSGPLDWDQLVQLRELYVLDYKGQDATILQYLASPKSTISEFTWWDHGQKKLDFSRAVKLETLGLAVSSARLSVKLPEQGDFYELRLLAPPADCRISVSCPDYGRGKSLVIFEGNFLEIRGLKQIAELNLFETDSVDLAHVAKAYPKLESIQVMGKSVSLTGITALARLKSLKKMWFHGCYGMDAAEFPELSQLPSLEEVDFNGLRAEDAVTLKKKFRNVKELHIAGKRTPEWIANHLGNPFRNWDEEFGRAIASKAIKAWSTANSKLTKLEKSDPVQGREILKAFVAVFNQIESRSGLETDQRETIHDAFAEFVARLPSGTVTEDDYHNWAKYS